MDFLVTAYKRSEHGRNAVRRLRREGKSPGVIYGIGEPQSICVDSLEISRQLHQEAFYSSLIKLVVDGKPYDVLLRETQVHPVINKVLHIDFQVVASDKPIAATVPLHFENIENCPGVKVQHGVFSVIISELHVHCLPKDLPDRITIDVGNLEMGQTIHVGQVPVILGVNLDLLQRGEDPAIATITAPKVEVEKVETSTDAEDDTDGKEPVAEVADKGSEQQVT